MRNATNGSIGPRIAKKKSGMPSKFKIAIVVPGRWSAFELTTELSKRGHDVALLTNYPKWIVKRFGVNLRLVRSGWRNFVFAQTARQLHDRLRLPLPESLIARHFTRWAASELVGEEWDAVLVFSQFAEEILRALRSCKTLKILNRENSHIKIQARILEEESRRTGISVWQPSSWAIAREEREYQLADRIRVVAHFSRQTFLDEGVPAEKVWCIPSGVPVETFRPTPELLEERCRRIRNGEPLRVIFVGGKVLRKGLWDLLAIVRALHGSRFRFRLVGHESSEAKEILRALAPIAELVPKQPQRLLPQQYAWADLYLFPSLEEGFPQTTAQAWANGLPILTTPNGGGLEFVKENQTGWVLPARDPQAYIDQLRWCDEHREELAIMVQNLHRQFAPRNWSTVAQEFERAVGDYLFPSG